LTGILAIDTPPETIQRRQTCARELTFDGGKFDEQGEETAIAADGD
jgi:hypothetical protein